MGSAARAFGRFTSALHALLPRPLKRIPVTFIGYCFINGSAFALDMGLLSILYGVVGLPYPVAVTLGYAVASLYSFVINRWLNFQAHGHVGAQSARYSVTMVSNYAIWILGFSWLMEHLGVQFQLARFLAACIEGIYIYVLLRWWVFRDAASPASDEPRPDELHIAQSGSLQSTGAEPAASRS